MFFSRFGAQFFEWHFFWNDCRILSDYTSLNICYTHFNKTSRRSMVISLFMVGPLDSSSPQAGQVHDSGHRNWNMESSRGTAHKLQGPWKAVIQAPKSRKSAGMFLGLSRNLQDDMTIMVKYMKIMVITITITPLFIRTSWRGDHFFLSFSGPEIGWRCLQSKEETLATTLPATSPSNRSATLELPKYARYQPLRCDRWQQSMDLRGPPIVTQERTAGVSSKSSKGRVGIAEKQLNL